MASPNYRATVRFDLLRSMVIWGTLVEEGVAMSIARRKIQIRAFLGFATIMGCIQTAEAQTVTLDCSRQTGVTASPTPVGFHGWRVIVNYSTNTVEWFGYLMNNGSTFALVYGAPAAINDTTITWQVPYTDTPTMTDSINRSTGILYFQARPEEQQVTGLCSISQEPPPRF